MQVQVVTAESRQKVLAEAKRKLGQDPLVLSVRRKRGEGGIQWEAVVAADRADELADDLTLAEPEASPVEAQAPGAEPTDLISGLGGLKSELAHLRVALAAGKNARPDVLALAHRLTMLEREIVGATLADRQVSPRWSRLMRRLEAAGYGRADAVGLVEALEAEAPQDDAETRRALRTLLLRNVEVASAQERISPRLVVFSGAAGVGKTSLAAKLAADLSLGGSARPVLGVLRPRPGAGREVMRGCAQTLGLEYAEAHNGADLERLWNRSEERPVILDSSAINPQNGDSIEQMAALFEAVPEAEVHAVVPAGYEEAEFCRTLTSYSCFPRVRLSVTRFDEAPRPGRVLAAAAKTGVPVGYFSLGPRIPDDLARPGLEGLASSVLRASEATA
ncbi:MAG TPA: hypothetical protein RMG48_09695 [Myxococcales bacterium LLY-WYZ-16_1]|jgi:flagellar biosynthesis protein FlhF|nr:hypothetical protein [Myxococcales bacterium LLY-WYZ-16_1]